MLEQEGLKEAELTTKDLLDEIAQLKASIVEYEAYNYSITHDLRAPVRAIVGFAELLEQEGAHGLSPRQKEMLDTILGEAKRLGLMIDGLHAYMRLSKVQATRTIVNMNELVADTISGLNQMIAGRKIEFKIGDLPAAMGDLRLLRTLWEKLIDNAIKFTGQREVATVTVDSYQQDGEVVYFVKDNGAGFIQKYATRLFGVFQRLHTITEFEGVGLGLAMAERIVKLHGGSIRAEGERDQGATVYFTLSQA